MFFVLGSTSVSRSSALSTGEAGAAIRPNHTLKFFSPLPSPLGVNS